MIIVGEMNLLWLGLVIRVFFFDLFAVKINFNIFTVKNENENNIYIFVDFNKHFCKS